MGRKLHKAGSISGYTLIETLVSGVLLVFAVTAAVAVVGTGTQLETSDNERRQARALLRSVLEQSYDYRYYDSIPAVLMREETVQIDPRMGMPLTGQLTHTISAGTVLTGAGITCPVKHIRLSLRWTRVDGVVDSISMSKLVADIL